MWEIKTVKQILRLFPMFFILIMGCEEYRLKVIEEKRVINTYPFSEPNPIPILTQDKRLYPYHKFLGYSHEAVPQEWNVIKLSLIHI